MSVSHRISRYRKSHLMTRRQFNQQTAQITRHQPIRGSLKAPANERQGNGNGVKDHWLATQRKPLEEVEPIWLLRWLLRKYFQWRGFACRSHVCNNEDGRHRHGKTIPCPNCQTSVAVLCDGKCYASIEYRGTFAEQAAARWAANCPGGEVKPIPFNAPLPEETVSYGVGDVPQSEASQFYRKGVALPFIAVPRERMAQLEEKVEQVVRSASA